MRGASGALCVAIATLLVCCSADPHQDTEVNDADHIGGRFNENELIKEEYEDLLRYLQYQGHNRNLAGIGGSNLLGRGLNGIGGSNLLGRNINGIGGTLLGRSLNGIGGSNLLGRNINGIGGTLLGRNINGIGGTLLGRNLNGIGGSGLIGRSSGGPLESDFDLSQGRNLAGIGGTLLGRNVEGGRHSRFVDSLGGGNFVRNLDSIGGGNFVRNLDSIGGGNFVKKNLDHIGGPNLVKKNLDSIGGGNLVRNLDSIGGGNFVRELDSIGGVKCRPLYGNIYKDSEKPWLPLRTWPHLFAARCIQVHLIWARIGQKTKNMVHFGGGSLVRQTRDSGQGFIPYLMARQHYYGSGGKRELWPMSASKYTGYYDYPKRNFDEIDLSGLNNFVKKRNIDEIDQTSMPFPYAKRFNRPGPNHSYLSNLDKKRYRADYPMDEIDLSHFPIGSKRSEDSWPLR